MNQALKQQKLTEGAMAESKHTPGPWTYEVDRCAACTERGEAEYCVFGPPGGYHAPFSNEADARLIAAAPDLLAALKELEQCCSKYYAVSRDLGHWHPEYWPELAAARAAIEKAEGNHPVTTTGAKEDHETNNDHTRR
jgi:hypothetical protein